MTTLEQKGILLAQSVHAYRKASANYKRAKTNHAREQRKGETDGGVEQTRRMYFAAMAVMRAAHKYSDAQRELFQGRG